MPARPDGPHFYLDECLPYAVAEALATVGHAITSARAENRLQELDERLIPWLAQQDYVWVTKDDAARFEHQSILTRHSLSIVWIRGIDRRKNSINAKELHLILTVKLDQIAEAIRQARGPRWFLLYLGPGSRPTLRPLTVGQPIPGTRRERRSQ